MSVLRCFEHLNAASTAKELHFNSYFILIPLNIKSHPWFVAAMLDSTALEQ